jgi:hypothetical protein
LFLTDGTLLAVYSQAAAIITKGADTVALIAADLVITGVPAGSVTVGDTTFDYPQATETIKGVAEIATTAEAQAGTDDERILTPAKLQSVTSTETRRGVIELATNAEVQAGTDTSRAVTPAGLASRTATETRTGVIEIATNAEVLAGTDTDRAVTPAGLAARTATTTRTGVIEIATQSEVDLGSDTTRAVTPQTLKLTPGTARAWVNFRGTGTVSPISSHGVTSITDLGVGQYAINWAGVFDSPDYAWVGSARLDVDAQDHMVVSAQLTMTKTSGVLQIKTTLDEGAVRDSPEVNVVAFA